MSYVLIIIPYLVLVATLKRKRAVLYTVQALLGVLSILGALLMKNQGLWGVGFSSLVICSAVFIYDIRSHTLRKQLQQLELEELRSMKRLQKKEEKVKYFKMLEEFYIQIFDIYEKIRYETDYERVFNLIFTYFKDVFGLSSLAITIKDKDVLVRKFEQGIDAGELKYKSKVTRLQKLQDSIMVKTRQRHDLETSIFFIPEESEDISEEFEVFLESVLIALMRIYLYQKYDQFSKTDFLTGLFKKRVIMELLIEDFNRCMRRKMPLSVAFFDIDDFKSINDGYGHLIGDNVLKLFSGMLRKLSDHGFFVGRYGGEEFVVIMIGEKKENAHKRMDDIRRELEEHNFSDTGIMKRVTVSCGVASYPEDGETPYGILETADKRLYKAKNSGKNRVES